MNKVVVILGPTAVGKTAYAIDYALQVGSPIISCDSRQIYKEMTIGTAVPSKEELTAVPHYFIQTHSIFEPYSAGRYEVEALALVEKLFAEGHETLVMTGGSAFFIDAFCTGLDDFPAADPALRDELTARLAAGDIEGLRAELKLLDPESYASIDIANGQRVVRALEVCLQTGRKFSSFKLSEAKTRPFEIEKIGLVREREIMYERADARVEQMLADGLEEEARKLWPNKDLVALRTVGYREFFDYFDGLISRDEAIRLIKRNTRHYIKRQMTWWKRDESIKWIKL